MKTYETLFQLLFEAKDYLSGEKLAQSLGISRTSIWKAIKQLEKEGISIDSVKNKGYKWKSGDLLIPQLIEEACPLTVRLNPKSSSTQLDAKKGLEEGAPEKTLYLAPFQTAGRGRFDRPFYSPQNGGIYMSLHLKPNLPFDQVPPYTLLVAASIYQAVKNLTLLDLDIKWVNDLYYKDKKLAGILTEAITSVETGLVTNVIIGVGLNFAIPDFPKNLKEKATSLFEGNPSITRNELIAEIWQIFFQTKEEDLFYTYKDRSLVLGRTISFTQDGKTYQGRALDISAQGKLLVEIPQGQQIWLSGGEISLTSW